MVILIFLLFIIPSFSIFILFRNERVSKEKLKILNKVSILAKDDIFNNKPWEWRYDALMQISYSEMVFKFWKPVKSFYKNNDCLKKDIY